MNHFRLDLEQQRKRAKDLLKAARAGEAAALERFHRTDARELNLANAQRAIARELRYDDWPSLKSHLAALARERTQTAALDADVATLHIRCGSDIRESLHEAGFRGDFYEHNYPYLIGPVREGPGSLELRARFLADTYSVDDALAAVERAERTLVDSALYDRVVIWSERDVYDQLVLVRLLGHYALHARPRSLELINVADHPGGTRFLGLGQLPPEALRLLWTGRRPATAAQLAVGLDAWRALASPDPRALAALMRAGTPALPLLAPALARHLAELPSVANGLSCTQQMALTLVAERPRSLNDLFNRITYEIDPLPGQGDFQLRDRVLAMEAPRGALFTRAPGLDAEGRARPPWTDALTLTTLGHDVLAGHTDFRTLAPAPRWVGGARIAGDEPDWRWDEHARDVRIFSTKEFRPS